ncbi:CHASE3 domain-containing protein [Paenibacillus sp. FSL R7-0273]|uniref:CHASE3 domain-containing protein n=1 Tax=Paenibacillus sp. FSL R7-0273 TaxID=1536772 RepID=UPI001E56174C|nr:CHASE3 domain-containing protein [Paenibacillus sp. FSL R7-0273]
MLIKQPKSLKIRGRIALGYAVILVMLGLFLVIVSSRITDLEKETVYLSDHDIEVHELTYRIEKNVLDMETGQRGFSLTGDSSYLEPYNTGLSEWAVNYSKLKALITDNPYQLENLESIKQDIEKWIAEAGNYVVQLKQRGRDDEVALYFQNDSGKAVVDSIRAQSDYFRDNERQLTNNRIDKLKDSNQKLITTMYILWAMVALLALLITYLLSVSIVKPLQHVIQAINSIANGGNMSERIKVKTMDEVFDLGEATNGLLDKVQVDQWCAEQLASTSIILQETTDLSVMSRTFMNKLATTFEIQYGAIYTLDNEEESNRDVYKRMYSYAGSIDAETPYGAVSIRLGEGLVGQCALDRVVMFTGDLPEDYISINSALGRTAPKFAVIAPVVFENKTLAVVEFASLTKWPAHHVELLYELLKALGVSLNSLITRMEIQSLYQDSQALNEELQVQSEELQVQSEELQVQTEELQNHTSELMDLNRELENQKSVAENAAVELDKYNKQLELSSRYKSEFLANMSHELRTPLNSMLILSQLLVENRNNTLTGEELEYASVIHSSGSELLTMINDILDLSKVEAGKMLVEMDAVNLTELPALLTGYFDKTAEQQHLDFSIRLGDNVPDLFFTDELRLHQILRNLLSNAFKFTEEGFVRVEISCTDYQPAEPGTAPEQMLAFAVTDSGIGISEANRELIFEAFRQADGTTARKFGGTGLGLSISLQLAKLLGGYITLESQEGKGSTFTLYLPYLQEESDLAQIPLGSWYPAAATIERNEPPDYLEEQALNDSMLFQKEYEKLHGRTVLIVDDDLRNIYALESGFVPYGMNILTAQNGYECLQIVREQPELDIVLLDIMMPNLDGYDTLSIIREELLLRELPIIAVSAKTMKEDREKCLAAGASDFISKPVVLQDVVTRMCRLIGPPLR